jgi:predicted transcriptional regulator YheO
MSAKNNEATNILNQLGLIARGLGETFAPFCEVVVHDLQDPNHAIHAIHNNLSGRQVGDPATELGLARIADTQYPEVIANYANRFPDGRQAKSTSIGIKDSNGRYVAALCMNLDLSLFQSLQSAMGQFTNVVKNGVTESLDTSNADAIRQRIDEFAARQATTPRALKTEDKRLLLRELKGSGYLEVRKSMEVIAQHLGVSRAAAYSYVK